MISVQYLRQSNTERLIQKRQASKLKTKLRDAGLPLINSDTHIVPVMVKDAAKCTRISNILLQDFGIYVQPINYPTVPIGTERLRLTPGPLHNDAMIDHLVDALSQAFNAVASEQIKQAG